MKARRGKVSLTHQVERMNPLTQQEVHEHYCPLYPPRILKALKAHAAYSQLSRHKMNVVKLAIARVHGIRHI